MALGLAVARSPRLPPPVPQTLWDDVDVTKGSRSSPSVGSSARVLPPAPANPLEALRAEAESLAKIRRDLSGGRQRSSAPSEPSTKAPPASAGKLVASSKTSSSSSKFRGQRSSADGGAPPLAPWDTPAPSSPQAAEPLATSVIPKVSTPRTTTSTGNSESSATDIIGALNGLDRQHMERRQLIDWGENLYQEVSKLEQDKARLARSFAESELERQRVDAELDQMRRRCTELERLLRQHGEGSKQASQDGQKQISEMAELRKQLAAYAVEIDVLRDEKQAIQQSLRESQDAFQQLTIERDGLVRSLQEVERRHHEKEQHCTHLQNVINEHGDAKNAMEGQLRNAMSELGVVGASLQLVQERGSDTQRHAEMAVVEAERLASEKDRRIAALVDVVRPLREQLSTMQESFVKQTREFGQFIQQVRQRQQVVDTTVKSASQSLQEHLNEAYELPRLLEQLTKANKQIELGQHQAFSEIQSSRMGLQSELEQAQEQQRRHEEEQKRLQADVEVVMEQDKRRKETRKARLQHRVQKNILKQMIQVVSHGSNPGGQLLQKVTFNGGKGYKKEYRKVLVDEENFRLKWVKHPYNFGRGESSVDLDRIIQIGYGCRARAAVLYPADLKDGVFPWHCFSVYTVERSYDFICKDVIEAEAFVLTISRLCYRIGGWAVPGSIHSHPAFVCARGWSKVENICRLERKTLAALIMDAIYKVANGPTAKPGSQSASFSFGDPRGGNRSNASSAVVRTGSPAPAATPTVLDTGAGVALSR